MARRGGTARFRCAQADCTEHAVYDYSSRADYDRLAEDKRKHPWRCTRHRNPEELLGAENLTTTKVLVATPSDRVDSDALFWHDGNRLGSGLTYGDGYKAFASDFPPGTRLVITARIELPEEPQP